MLKPSFSPSAASNNVSCARVDDPNLNVASNPIGVSLTEIMRPTGWSIR